jgi:hypothetical protein
MGYWHSAPLIDRLFHDVVGMFNGQYPGFLPIDMRYHDLEHTLQATVCLCKILEGYHTAAAQPRLVRRDCELALAAVLLHDSGYLKETHDTSGTGAKYTFVHESRSCNFARSYLPLVGFSGDEVSEVTTAIGCTGPKNRIAQVAFVRPESRILTAMLVTADYLSQMAAPNYVEKLPFLFLEFTEAYDFERLPADQRQFDSARQLLDNTPDFWDKQVRPMLDNDLLGLYRLIADDPTGANSYLAAIERNIGRLRQTARD